MSPTSLMSGLWSCLDEVGALLDETEEEAQQFEHQTRAELSSKYTLRLVAAPGPANISFDAGPPIHNTTSSHIDSPANKTIVLPPPPPSPVRSKRSLPHLRPTQDIPSPKDSPLSKVDGEGQGRRDDPATPLPLGIATFTKLRSKKDFQTVSKHFETFERGLNRELKRVDSKGKAREEPIGILTECRICMPPETGRASKLKQRWDIIAKLGGKVVLQPDTAITHVIYDGRSASTLAKELGLSTISELPKGTVCIKWDWVAQCKIANRRLDLHPWLTFKNALQRDPIPRSSRSSRISDITEQLKGSSVTSVRKRRENTASESETESSKRVRPYTTASARVTPQNRSAKTSPAPDERSDQNRTRHQVAKEPGWVEANSVHRDGLDEVISGIQTGELEEDEDDTNPCLVADRFKCGKASTSQTEGPNEWLAKKFDQMHNMYSGAKHKNNWQVRGYMLAAAAIRRTKWPIQSGEAAKSIKGIGESMISRIDEFLDPTRQGRQFYDMDEQMQATTAFTGIYGVGKNQAFDLYQRGARSLQDLAQPSNPYNLSAGQLIGLEYYDDLNTRIPREECKRIYDILRSEAQSLDPKLWIEIMGSYRRGQKNSGDVDILITRDDTDGNTHFGILEKLMNRLMAIGLITHELSQPRDWNELEAKWMGICRLDGGLHRRIDVLCIPFENWGAALIYFTGNDIFNRSLRLYARKLGYSLNQRGLSSGITRGRDGLKQTEGVLVGSRTEQEIFDKLGVRWRPPHQRRP